jgi:dTDP-4-dehydrorhamnose 3,5-epimerase-like enzyme
MKLRTIPHPRISTKDSAGQVNGFLIPVYNVHEGFLQDGREPKQVYLTVCAPGTQKGPHLHLKRWGYFTCIRGNARVVARLGEEYVVAYTGQDHQFQTIEVPAGVPAVLENVGDEDAYIINTPSPAWRADDQDEHPVTGWNPPASFHGGK